MTLEKLILDEPVEALTQRFAERLPDKQKIEETYQTVPTIKTKLKISHATNGELRIICESSKYAKYLMDELRKIRDDKGEGLNCFYADKTEDCACFYIAASHRQVAGQNTKVFASSRLGTKDDVQKKPLLNNYGVYESKGDPHTGKNKKLSLNCPGEKTEDKKSLHY